MIIQSEVSAQHTEIDFTSLGRPGGVGSSYTRARDLLILMPNVFPIHGWGLSKTRQHALFSPCYGSCLADQSTARQRTTN